MFVTSRIIFALAVLCACNAGFGEAGTTPTAPTGLVFQLDPQKITPGQRARLTVALPLASVGLADVDEETQLPTLRDDLLLETDDIQVLERDFRRERDNLIWTFDVTAHKDGKYNLPPLEVRSGGQTFSTEAVPLTVKSNRPPGDEALRPDFESVRKPWNWLRLLLILAVALVAGFAWKKSTHQRRLASRLFARAWHRLRRWLEAPAPESVLRWELAGCRSALAAGHPPEAVLDRATRAVREYLAHRRENAANAWTTDELRANAMLSSAFLERTFIEADVAKFAGGPADARRIVEDVLAAATAALTGPRNEVPARAGAFLRATRRWVALRFAPKTGGAR